MIVRVVGQYCAEFSTLMADWKLQYWVLFTYHTLSISSAVPPVPVLWNACPGPSDWSPQQIAGWLARELGNDDSRRVSHETIYRTLFIQTRGALQQELVAHLRRGRSMRYGRHYRGKSGTGGGQIVDAVSIRERPAQAEDRAVPGHWEGDLLCGTPGTQIATGIGISNTPEAESASPGSRPPRPPGWPVARRADPGRGVRRRYRNSSSPWGASATAASTRPAAPARPGARGSG